MNRPTWLFRGWRGIALPASVVPWITSGRTRAAALFLRRPQRAAH